MEDYDTIPAWYTLKDKYPALAVSKDIDDGTVIEPEDREEALEAVSVQA